jgi:TolA-binding protein
VSRFLNTLFCHIVFCTAFSQPTSCWSQDVSSGEKGGKSTPSQQRQLYERAAHAIASADPSAAILPLEQLLKDGGSSALGKIACVHLAECQLQLKQPDQAAEVLENWAERIRIKDAALKIAPELIAHHARVWLQAGRSQEMNDQSIHSLKALLDHLEKCEVSEDLDAVRTSARMELAKRLITTGQLELANIQLNELNPSGISPGEDVLLIRGLLLQKLGQHEMAKELFAELIKGDSKSQSSGMGRLELAGHAVRVNQLVEAGGLLQPLFEALKAARANGTRLYDIDFECRFRLLFSDYALASSQPKLALEVLPTDEELEQFKPTQRVALRFARAEAAARARQQVIAMSDLNWLSREAAEATVTPAWAPTVELRRCELLLAEKNFEQLERAASAAQQKYSNFERSHEFDYLLARSAMLQIDFDRARELLIQIVASQADNKSTAVARAQWMLGETFFLEQKYEAAITAYQPATQLNEQQPWQVLSQFQTGKCLELLNRPTEALETYQLVLDATHDVKLIEEANVRIQAVQRTAQSQKPNQRR